MLRALRERTLARRPPANVLAKAEEAKPQPEKPTNGLEAEIARQIGPLVNQNQRGEVVSRVVSIMRSESFAGPIAHPRHLREYDDIVPGSAERIIRMAEKAQDHNIAMETKVVSGEIDDRRLGMFLGFAALILLLGLAAFFGYYDKPIIAGLFLTAAALGSVGVFIKGRIGK